MLFCLFFDLGECTKTFWHLAGYQLTSADVNVYIKTLQFVIGQKIKPTEALEIKKEAIKGFNENPTKFLTEVKQTDDLMNKIYQIKDPLKIAEGRLLFLGEFYKMGQNTPRKDWSAILKIQNRYVKVLRYNAQTGLLLTSKDIDSFLNFIDFIRQLNGELPLTIAVKNEFRETLTENYAELSASQQALFAVMPIIWQIVDGQWKKLSLRQRKNVMAQYRAQNMPRTTASAKTSSGRSSTKNTRNRNISAQQKQLSKQTMYQMMSNISRSQHLTTMNILENMGGTGDYWTYSPSF